MSAAVEGALARFFTDGGRHVGSADHDALWSAVRDAADGGKRIRPMLLATVYEGLGGTDHDAAGEVAAALELLHTAFVIHDDVIDGDTVRRGRPNVSGTFAAQARRAGLPSGRAAGYGDAAGILAGDLALAGAVRTVALCGADPDTVRRMLDLVDRALHVSAAGELADVRLGMFGGRDLTETLTMEEHKTAVYSFELPLQLAAVLAGSDDDCVEALGRFGLLLGVAFQLRDDLDGMFGDRTRTGKSALTDLREGKCTPLIAYARTTDAWSEIRPHLGSPTVDEDTAVHVRGLLLACGAHAFVEDLATSYTQAAAEAVAHLPVAPLLQDWITAVTDDVRSAA